MTLSALGVAAVYLGSGSTGPFTLQDHDANPILFEDNSDIVVQRCGLTGEYGTPTTLTITADYTLTGAGLDTAGAVTLTSSISSTQMLLIRRQTPRTQETDMAFGGDLSLENLEEQLDKQVRLIQELREQTDRALLFSATETALIGTATRVVPAPEAGKVLAWNEDEDRLENITRPASFLSGAGAPSSALGVNGDFYLDTDDDLLYGPKALGAWGSGVSLIGPQGEQGIQGIQGIQGLPGASGSGTGDVVTNDTIVDNEIVLYDGDTGDVIKGAGMIWADLLTEIADKYVPGGTDVTLADGGTGTSLADPGADRIMFWDDSEGVVAFLATSTGLTISGANISLSHLGLQTLVDPNADRLMAWDDSSGFIDWITASTGLEFSTTNLRMTANQRLALIPFLVDGAGSAITTGIKGDIEVPFACTITAARLFADTTGSIVFDIWKDTFANFPPAVGDTITASAKPTITGARSSQDTTLTGWTTSIAAGDILRFNVDSATTITRATLALTVTKT